VEPVGSHRRLGIREAVDRLRGELREHSPRRFASALLRAYADYDTLTCASAISFQVAFALIPLSLFVLAALGLANLEELWSEDVAPDVAQALSGPAFELLDDTVTDLQERRQVFWATAGLAIAVFEVSGAVRAFMGAVDRIYEIRHERTTARRYLASAWLAIVVSALLVLAVAVVELAPRVGHGSLLLDIARWPLAAAILLAVFAILGRYAPAIRRPWHWVTFGAVLAVGGWIAFTAGFAVYLTQVADYGSLFGNLATVIVGFEYLYLSVIVLLTGVLADAVVRTRVGRGDER
jgi:membrane protein